MLVADDVLHAWFDELADVGGVVVGDLWSIDVGELASLAHWAKSQEVAVARRLPLLGNLWDIRHILHSLVPSLEDLCQTHSAPKLLIILSKAIGYPWMDVADVV